MKKSSTYVINWRVRVKRQLVAYKGGKCEKCGYCKDVPNCYDFHHINPAEKEFTISGKSWNFERLKKEVDKCQLLCKNCHAELHDSVWLPQRLENLKILRKPAKPKEIRQKNAPRKTTPRKYTSRGKILTPTVCKGCGMTYQPTRGSQIHCTEVCYKNHSRKVERPNKEELEKLLWELPTTQIAAKYGVSDKAVEKWSKSYGLTKPPRGYWAKLRS